MEDTIIDIDELKDKLGDVLKDKIEGKVEKIKEDIEKLVPRTVKLDQFDNLYIENIMMREQNEVLRSQLTAKVLSEHREKLHDHIVSKYKIDLDNYDFSIDDKKVLTITPK
jgi:hypothetical protein